MIITIAIFILNNKESIIRIYRIYTFYKNILYNQRLNEKERIFI